MSDRFCVVCHTKPGPVCDDDLAAMTTMLTDLPRRLRQLATALVPGQAEPRERATRPGAAHAPLPARLNALSLVGPGTSEITVRLNPLVRHWSVTRTVQVQTHVAGLARMVEAKVTDWFHETVTGPDGRPVLVPEDDQIGTVPPREWLDAQVRRWRVHFSHTVPRRTLRSSPVSHAHMSGRHHTLLRVPDGQRILAFLAAAATVGGDYQRATHYGLLGYQEPAQRSLDPLLDDIERRFGQSPREWAVEQDVRYLTTWLAAASAAPELDIAEFGAQLRALHAEISQSLGETPEQQWIGRCPAFILEEHPDQDTGDERVAVRRPCGAGLWQDTTAMAAQTQCPRCRSVFDVRGPGAVHSAREIRRVWPLDRRRRYSAADIDILRRPTCPNDGQKVTVAWKDVTGTRDEQRWWTPTSTSCPHGCDEARRIL